MNAKEGGNRPAALGRGLDTLMGRSDEDSAQVDWKEAQEAVEGDGFQEPDGVGFPAAPDHEPQPAPRAPHEGRSLEKNACLVGGLIASGAAGALAVAAFTLLGVRAVLAMGRR